VNAGMRNTILIALTIAIASVLPAAAQSANGKSVAVKNSYSLNAETDDYGANSNAPKQGVFSRALAAPKKVVGVTCGVAVGVPVTIARETKKHTASMKKSMAAGFGAGEWNDQSSDVGSHMLAGACAIPYGIGTGLITGSIKGFQKGVSTGGEKPLSKESMGFGDQK